MIIGSESTAMGFLPNDTHQLQVQATTSPQDGGYAASTSDSSVGVGPPLLSELTEFVFQIIFYDILCAVVSLFGTVANVINVVVFFRLGLFTGSSSNLNLFFLSVADLGISFTGLLHSIGFCVITADFQDDKQLSWDPFSVTYLVAGWPNMIFVIVNRLLTAYIVFERCVCVVLPFRVKTLFTPRKSLVYMTALVAFASLNLLPVYLFNRLGFVEEEKKKQDGERGKNVSSSNSNSKSKLVLITDPEWGFYHNIVDYVSFFALSSLCVIVVLVCTFITATRIRTSNKWKKTVKAAATTTTTTTTTTSSSSCVEQEQKTASSSILNGNSAENDTIIDDIGNKGTGTMIINNASAVGITKTEQKDNNSASKESNTATEDGTKPTAAAVVVVVDKEMRLVKTINIIAVIFLVCYIPELTVQIVQSIDPRIQTYGQYYRLTLALYSIVFVVTAFNSSINIFVYYTMNSRYRHQLLTMVANKSLLRK